jgi:hypothetical protein
MIRPRRQQAKPLWQGADWQITRADLWGFVACLLMLGFWIWLWRALSPW